MQGIGFTDEVERADIGAIANAAQDRGAKLSQFTINVVPARVHPEALLLPVHPADLVIVLRAAIREAIADV